MMHMHGSAAWIVVVVVVVVLFLRSLGGGFTCAVVEIARNGHREWCPTVTRSFVRGMRAKLDC